MVLTAPAPDVLHVAADALRSTLRLRFWHGPTDGAAVSSAVVAALGVALRARAATWAVDAPPPQDVERRVPPPPV